jgi:hypothetical protein
MNNTLETIYYACIYDGAMDTLRISDDVTKAELADSLIDLENFSWGCSLALTDEIYKKRITK